MIDSKVIFLLWLIQVEVRIFISVLVAPLNTRRGLVTGAPITQIPLFLLYPAGRFGPATQLWFDFKFGSACSTLSVGRDSRRVKKSHKERTVGRDSLSPFFFFNPFLCALRDQLTAWNRPISAWNLMPSPLSYSRPLKSKQRVLCRW